LGGTPDGTVHAHLQARHVEVDGALLARLEATGATVTTAPGDLAEASRDWWPLAMTWAAAGEVGGVAGAVVRPTEVPQVAAVLALCHETHTPVVAAGGRSGVCGASVPVHGGLVLDLTGLSGIVDVDQDSLVLDVLAGTFGDTLEAELRATHLVTLGHWPQSMNLSTVGGWLACRSAGQFSTRYGKIEDLVVGLDVVLADGRTITTGGHPRQATGPDLTQLFVGCEGTLGVITGARLRVRPLPAAHSQSAWGVPSFATGLELLRRLARRGARPAALRLHDATEADGHFHTGADLAVVLAYDEGEAAEVAATSALVAEEASALGASRLGDDLVDRWLVRRNDVSALAPLVRSGLVVDTMEVSGRWSVLRALHEATTAAIRAVEGTVLVTAHQSHSYPDGGCLYFTFVGQPGAGGTDRYHRQVWDSAHRAALGAGAARSHQHRNGQSRGPLLAEALGPAFDVLVSLKAALDPRGVLNPGKLGLPSPFGEVSFP
jgi:alkyldihydroxyacetonephosphate synthase